MNTSASTRFGNRRKVITISFRRYVGSSGMIRRLYSEYKRREEKNGTAYARRYATWEFNNKPGLYESLLEDIQSKPEESACMLESKDDEGYFDSWIKDTKRIETAMKHTGQKWIFDMPVPKDTWQDKKDSEYVWEDSNGQTVVLDPYNIPLLKRGIKGIPYVLCGDPGLGNVSANGDSFGITLAHAEEYVDESNSVWRKPIIDFTFRYTGRMFPEGEIQLVAIQYLIEKLFEYGYDIQIFSFDGWQSAATTQWIAKKYPGSIVMHRNLVETRDYTALRDAIFSEVPPSSGEGKIGKGAGIGLFWHPVLYWELSELRTDREKGKVDHTETTSKDMSDSLAKAVRIITLQWPFGNVGVAGSPKQNDVASSEGARRVAVEMKRAEDIKKRERYTQAMNSNLIGLGRFKR